MQESEDGLIPVSGRQITPTPSRYLIVIPGTWLSEELLGSQAVLQRRLVS